MVLLGIGNDAPIVTATRVFQMSKCHGILVEQRRIVLPGNEDNMEYDQESAGPGMSYQTTSENDVLPGWARSCSHLSFGGNHGGRIHAAQLQKE